MTKYKNSSELIEAFIDGETEGFAGSNLASSNLKIKGDFVVHFFTNILERNGNEFILNKSGYSRQTRLLQELIEKKLVGKTLSIVLGVPMDYRGPLSVYVRKE